MVSPRTSWPPFPTTIPAVTHRRSSVLGKYAPQRTPHPPPSPRGATLSIFFPQRTPLRRREARHTPAANPPRCSRASAAPQPPIRTHRQSLAALPLLRLPQHQARKSQPNASVAVRSHVRKNGPPIFALKPPPYRKSSRYQHTPGRRTTVRTSLIEPAPLYRHRHPIPPIQFP